MQLIEEATRKRSADKVRLVHVTHHLLPLKGESGVAHVYCVSCLPQLWGQNKQNAQREESAPDCWWKELLAEGPEDPLGGLDCWLRRALASERCFWSLSICSSFCCAWNTLNPIWARCTCAQSMQVSAHINFNKEVVNKEKGSATRWLARVSCTDSDSHTMTACLCLCSTSLHLEIRE